LKSKKISILHFNTFEYYPPVFNFVTDLLSENSHCNISIFSTKNISPFKKKEFSRVTIWRFGIISDKALIRYLSYIAFNLCSLIVLFIKQPDTVIIYETLSVFPAFVYSKIFKNKKFHIHYHEYTSLHEKDNASLYMKILYKFENILLQFCKCSHTNVDRKLMFINDNPNLNLSNVEVYPNLPPSTWWFKYGENKSLFKNTKIRLVYVGALDFHTMFLDEILIWVKANSDKLELTMFCHNLTDIIKERIKDYNSPNIFLKQPIDYEKLPEELVKYDIGLVLYKGLIPNHIYSVPNKVYEYLICGLHVIVDQKLITTVRLEIEQIQVVDFTKLDLEFVMKKLITVKIKMPIFHSQKLINII
jgi:hypothetical protein